MPYGTTISRAREWMKWNRMRLHLIPFRSSRGDVAIEQRPQRPACKPAAAAKTPEEYDKAKKAAREPEQHPIMECG